MIEYLVSPQGNCLHLIASFSASRTLCGKYSRAWDTATRTEKEILPMCERCATKDKS